MGVTSLCWNPFLAEKNGIQAFQWRLAWTARSRITNGQPLPSKAVSHLSRRQGPLSGLEQAATEWSSCVAAAAAAAAGVGPNRSQFNLFVLLLALAVSSPVERVSGAWTEPPSHHTSIPRSLP